MYLKDIIENAIDDNSDSLIIDGFTQNTIKYGDLKIYFSELDCIFRNIDFESKILIFDFNENNLNTIVLYLYAIVKKAIPLIVDLSTFSTSTFNELPYYGIVKNKISLFGIENDSFFEKFETSFGVISLRKDILQIKKISDCALLLTSSGTIGDKKLIKCGSKEIVENIISNVKVMSITRKDCTLLCLPIYYSYSLIGQFFSHFIQGAKIVIVPYKFISFNLSNMIERYKPTNFFTTPAQVNLLLGYSRKQPSFNFRFIAIGGGYLNRFSFFQFAKIYNAVNYFKTYGITEAGPRVSTYIINNQNIKNFQPNYLGEPLENVELLKGSTQGVFKNFETNKLQIKSPSLFKGYLTVNENAVPKDILETEDIVYYDNDNVNILGRKSDLYTFQDTEFWAFEVEELLYEHILGLVKIKLKQNKNTFHLGVMMHPKIRMNKELILEKFTRQFKKINPKNLVIENYNEQFEFTK